MENRQSDKGVGECFLCEPEPELTWASSPEFQAVLGLGPIGEGYSLLATRRHLPSMLDLNSEQAAELSEFTSRLRSRLRPLYGDVVLTEHGRVAPCVAPHVRAHEPHCLHAHRLVFPGRRRLDLRFAAPGLAIETFASFDDARRRFDSSGQYVYCENADGGVQVAAVPRPLPRQFLRFVAASDSGSPELTDWRRQPGLSVVAAAQRALGLAA